MNVFSFAYNSYLNPFSKTTSEPFYIRNENSQEISKFVGRNNEYLKKILREDILLFSRQPYRITVKLNTIDFFVIDLFKELKNFFHVIYNYFA